VSRRERPTMRTEILDLAELVFHQLGGRATSRDVQDNLREVLSEEQREYLSEYALGSIVGQFFRRRDRSGLPQAPEVNGAGTHCQLELITVDEWRYVIRKYVQRSDQNLDMAYRCANACKDVHGVWIDPATVIGETA
jgi:hypothetical protein